MRQNVNQMLFSAQYYDVPRTLEDIIQCIRSYPQLVPDLAPTRVGQQDILKVVLRGTIPVPIRGTVYHIPIAMFLDHGHPRIAPLCVVEPTQSMQVQESQHVDPRGVVKHECLWRWHESHSSLLNVVSQLVMVFSQKSPVVSVQPGSQQSTMAQQRQPYAQPQPQPPVEQQRHYGAAAYASTAAPARPPPPQHYAASNGGAASTGPPPMYSEPAPTTTHDEPKRIASDILRMSCVSAATDRVRTKLKALHDKSSVRIGESQQRNDELSNGRVQIEDIMSRVRNETMRTDDALTWFNGAVSRTQVSVRQLEGRAADMDVDSLVVPTAPLYGQLMELEAEDQALADVIYTLQNALSDPSLHMTANDKLTPMLVHIQRISRDQFRTRCALKKVRHAIAAAEAGR